MLLFRKDEEDTVTKYVNEALSRGYLTIYLRVNRDNNHDSNTSHTSKIALSEIMDYRENVNRGNILTFDTRTFYDFALAGDLRPFEELKVLIEEAIHERIASKRNAANQEVIVIVAGVAAELNRNEKFDECINVEKWWQKTHSEWLQKGLKVNVICPHLNPILGEGKFMHYKQTISSLHEIVVECGSKRC